MPPLLPLLLLPLLPLLPLPLLPLLPTLPLPLPRPGKEARLVYGTWLLVVLLVLLVLLGLLPLPTAGLKNADALKLLLRGASKVCRRRMVARPSHSGHLCLCLSHLRMQSLQYTCPQGWMAAAVHVSTASPMQMVQ